MKRWEIFDWLASLLLHGRKYRISLIARKQSRLQDYSLQEQGWINSPDDEGPCGPSGTMYWLS